VKGAPRGAGRGRNQDQKKRGFDIQPGDPAGSDQEGNKAVVLLRAARAGVSGPEKPGRRLSWEQDNQNNLSDAAGRRALQGWLKCGTRGSIDRKDRMSGGRLGGIDTAFDGRASPTQASEKKRNNKISFPRMDRGSGVAFEARSAAAEVRRNTTFRRTASDPKPVVQANVDLLGTLSEQASCFERAGVRRGRLSRILYFDFVFFLFFFFSPVGTCITNPGVTTTSQRVRLADRSGVRWRRAITSRPFRNAAASYRIEGGRLGLAVLSTARTKLSRPVFQGGPRR